MSPEQIQDPKRVDYRTDIYSLGVTFYHALTGQIPYNLSTDSDFIVQSKIVSEPLNLDNVPTVWQAVLEKCLHKNPEARVADAMDLLAAFDTAPILEIPTIERDHTLIVPSIAKNISVPEKTVVESKTPNSNSLKSENNLLQKEEKNPAWLQRNGKYLLVLLLLPLIIWVVSLSSNKGKNQSDLAQQEEIPASNETEYLTAVKKDGKWGFLNRKGREITPLKYESVGFFYEDFVAVEKNNKWGYMNKEGDVVIDFKYEDVIPFSDGMARVKKNGKYGYIDKRGNEKTLFEYDEANHFKNGIAGVEKNEKWGFINKEGEIVIPFQYSDSYIIGSNNNLIAVEIISGKWGYINKIGEVKIPFKYDLTFGFNNGIATVKKYGKYGCINKNGKVVIDFKYDIVYGFYEGLAEVELDNKYGLINTKGEQVIPAKYDDLKPDYKGKGIVVVKQNEKWKYLDTKGKSLFETEYEDADQFSEELAAVKRNNKWAYIILRTAKYSAKAKRIKKQWT